MPMHFVYIIQNQNNVFYKGYTTKPDHRLQQHNVGLSKYTADKGPWELVFLKSFDTKTEALKFELMLKRQNHRYLLWLIKSEQNEI